MDPTMKKTNCVLILPRAENGTESDEVKKLWSIKNMTYRRKVIQIQETFSYVRNDSTFHSRFFVWIYFTDKKKVEYKGHIAEN